MEALELFDLYNEGKITQTDLQNLLLLFEDSKYTDEEAKKKENDYFSKFKNQIAFIDSNEEKARILFEVMIAYTDLINNFDIDEKSITALNAIYRLIKGYPEKQVLFKNACEGAKRDLVYLCLKYKKKTGFTTTNKEVFKQILENTKNYSNEENNTENRSATR